MDAHRLRAPSADGALLAEPPLSDAPARLAANAAVLGRWEHDFQGRPASWLRPAVRSQVLEQARAFLASAGIEIPGSSPAAPERLVVTGHQPELFHPGVWVKNFAAGSLAAETGSLALNIVVDNDVPKSSTIRVPRRDGGRLRYERVPFDDRAVETPYEDLDVADESLFASFAGRVKGVPGGTPADPLIDEFWPEALRLAARTTRVGLRFALARRAVEGAWGVHNLEVPLSAVCETEGFLWFASHLLAHLPRFREVHNDALRRYRSVYGIRSRHHPVPALARQDDWVEAPFWAWRAGEPRRRPLYARQRARSVELRIGGDDHPFMALPLGPDREACCAVERLMTLPAQGVRLRTRALTTTMFARSLLGDLFLHGIGGAKYDELGDEVSRRFFGVEPPDYLTLSMTLWLGLGDDPSASGRLAAVDRERRDLTFNPDRHLTVPSDPEASTWLHRKRRAVAGPVETRAQRVERFYEIRRCNDALQGFVAQSRQGLDEDHRTLTESVRRNAIARNREFSLVLHSRSRLRRALTEALPGLRLADG